MDIAPARAAPTLRARGSADPVPGGGADPVHGGGANPVHTDAQYETMERSTLPECSDSTASIVAARPS